MAKQEALWPIYHIQQLDARLAGIERTHQALDDGSQLAQEVARCHQQVAELEAESARVIRETRHAELELATVEEKQQRIDAKLYSGMVTNPKELQAYEGEVQRLRQRKGALEDQVLASLDEKDQLQQRLSTARRAEREAHNQWKAQVAAYHEHLVVLSQEKQTVLQQREGLRRQADAALLRDYEAAARERRALVGVLAQDACGACGMVLPVRTLKQYRAVEEAELLCPSCGAHLLWRLPQE